MILEVIKVTKPYGHMDGRSDNVKTVYPPTNTVCGGGIINASEVVKYCFDGTSQIFDLVSSLPCHLCFLV